MRTLAPLVIFVYNREEITRKMLDAVNKNFLAENTEVFIFSDGWKSEKDMEKVIRVRTLIKEFKDNNNFKKVTVIEAEKNKGLANSIIGGVTKVMNEYGKVIVLEDDLITANNFLKFMNDCLDYYENADEVWSIGGAAYRLPHFSTYRHDVYACYRGETQGWGSWKNRWDMVDWGVADYPQFMRNMRKRHKFKRGGQDMVNALKLQMNGQTDSWAIRWCYCQSMNDKITILPRKSFIKNIGWGDAATHSKEDTDYFGTAIESEDFEYTLERVSIDKTLMRDFRKYFSKYYIFFNRLKEEKMIKSKLYDKAVSILYHKERKMNPNPIKDWPLEVISSQMGCNRGKPVDRYYIEKFLQENKKYITGAVMEIGDNTYTMRYGTKVDKSYIFTADSEYTNDNASVVIGDLQSGAGCEQEMIDCFILTQTLLCIYDIQSAANNIVKILKKGGAALITVSGISMLSEYDDSRWGHFWGFTETSLRRLFESIPDVKSVDIQSMGNPKTASAFLYGLSVEDLSRADFEKDDKLVPVMIAAVVKK